MTTGQIIKQKREEKKETQQQLADALGVHFSMIGQVERGTKGISLGLASEIAKHFGCEIKDLIPKS